MKFDDIMDLWQQDANMDNSELGEESLKIPQLHHKYYKMLVQEGLLLKKYEQDYKVMNRLKFEYYMGVLDEETLREHDWEPFQLKVLKQDLSTYIDSDADMQTIQAKIDIQKQKIAFLESVVKMVSNRGFLIKNAIDWERFKVGG
jgi:ferredoxin-fold anticodon binding domain-containing protein